jgi:hypothetical protein
MAGIIRMRNMSGSDSDYGDVVRIVLGFVATLILVAVLFESNKSWGLVAICASVAGLCIITARNRVTIVYGIAVIMLSRILIGGSLALLRYLAHSPR